MSQPQVWSVIHPILLVGTSLPPNSSSKLTVCFKPFHLFHSNRQMTQGLWSRLSVFCGNNVGVLPLGRFFTTQLRRNGTPQELSLLCLGQLVFGYGKPWTDTNPASRFLLWNYNLFKKKVLAREIHKQRTVNTEVTMKYVFMMQWPWKHMKVKNRLRNSHFNAFTV